MVAVQKVNGTGVANTGMYTLGDAVPVFVSAKDAVLWVARRIPQPFIASDIDDALNIIKYVHKPHTVHSALYTLKTAGDIRALLDTKPMQYEVAEAAADDPAVVKEPLSDTELRQLFEEEAPAPAPAPAQVPHDTAYLLTEAIEHLIIKIAEIQAVTPQITLQVDLGDAARLTIAELERQLAEKAQQVAELRILNEALANRLTSILDLAGIAELH